MDAPLPHDRVTAALPAREQRDLVTFASLLADESPVVQRAVRRELERRGRSGLSLLRKVAVQGEPRARSQARHLLVHAGRERIARRMINFACRESPDLERGLLLLSRFEEPGLDLRPYLLAIDAMAAEVLKRLDARRQLDGRAKILVDYLGRELGYRGDRDDYHHPDNVYLHRAIVRKRGLPLTLTALYLLVARRARIRAAAVALPGHVVLRIYEEDGRSTLVDPFDSGAVLTERDCLHYLAQHGLAFQPRWFDDTPDLPLWARHVQNLRTSYARRGLEFEVRLLERLTSTLERRTSA